MSKCPHCGLIHETTCARIKAIEYQDNGVTVKRVEFHAPAPIVSGPSPDFRFPQYAAPRSEGCNIHCGALECAPGCKHARLRSSHIPRGAGTG